MKKHQLQQGDVTLRRVSELPKGAVACKSDPRGIVLAEGEVTGHFHGIKAKRGLRLHRIDDLLFLENATKAPVVVTHQEHNPISIEPGIWQVGQVREFDYLTQMARTVVD